MTVVNRVLVETLHIVERELGARALGGTQTIDTAAQTATTSSSTATMSSTGGGGGGGTSSPLLFFVALGFGVVFTNLWIIVGVKYCFRYNARNRAIRNGEEVDQINLENMPTRPHRRRREKKLMTMDEVNERFPLTKYKTWVATRAHEGLPTTGGVTAPPSRPGSLRDVDAPSSPVDTKHSMGTRPATASSEEVTTAPNTRDLRGDSEPKKSLDNTTIEVEKVTPATEKQNSLEHVRTTSSTVDKTPTTTSELEDDDDDDHIHTAVPPELLTNPGDSCAICIDTLEDDDDIRGLTCGHAFHAGCLDPWLTSRRACCPLCKADYYVPKPRPEGETGETDRSGRRRDRLPQPPASAWTGIRGGPRLMLPARFAGYPGDGSTGRYPLSMSREERRARNERAAAVGAASDAAEAEERARRRRWIPRISNPFSSIHMPRMPGRSRQENPAQQTGTDPSPSQLESGTVVR